MGSGKLEGTQDGRAPGVVGADWLGASGGWMELMDGRQACESGRVGAQRSVKAERTAGLRRKWRQY